MANFDTRYRIRGRAAFIKLRFPRRVIERMEFEGGRRGMPGKGKSSIIKAALSHWERTGREAGASVRGGKRASPDPNGVGFVCIRFRPDQLELLDRLVAANDQPSRSALICLALDRYCRDVPSP